MQSNNSITKFAPEEITLTYPGWEHDKEQAEKLFIEYSSTSASDCFNRKIVAMKNKQRLHIGDRSHPDIVALDSTEFTYNGWELDKEDCEKRLTGDCILLHMGTFGFQDLFNKMLRKQALHADRTNVEGLRELDETLFDYPGFETDKLQAEKFYVDYSNDSRDDCFFHKVKAMKNKQRLHHGDRSHPEIVALDKTYFSYRNWERDMEEAVRRHTGDCVTFNLGSGFESLFQKMKKRQKMHENRASLEGLKELDALQLTYPSAEEDRALCEKFYIEYSTGSAADCFHRKLVAMKNKQMLWVGDRSHPDIRALDGTYFNYDGWELDKKEAEGRLTGDCILLHMGSLGFNDVFQKMKKKQTLFVGNRSSIQGLRDLDALVGTQQDVNESPVALTPPAELLLATVSPTAQPSSSKVVQQDNHAKAPREEASVAQAAQKNKCVVCLDNRVSHAYIPCGHLCVCGECLVKHKSTIGCCPLCRERSYCVTKIYC